ncbi:hypothetical protein FHR83_001407 [Actinoplanes campanulatus]|uniref:Gram-positive cocci surface proteins LPxTG domain-containing protein n=1 Tax=Actinoplanes campanulatus TaxID=113559 RepID=A0A7W5FCT9_9ACTN|nr:hypothetical protein [Actinoplanes campanulatus]MBB3093758.1 hypothetical protein [Actinoplanes campanulatus]GGN05468.1 hypothetical protein GCM10010109_12800 [Actinoplanes campanulatus]GID35164.1 hypothetical protein Aca09nite_16700 [Actinoplanes campanulatus]
MPIARSSSRPAHLTAAAAGVAAALALPVAPAAATPATPAAEGCHIGDFTARAEAGLAKITMLDPGPLVEGLPALADVRLAVSDGTVNSAGRPFKTVAGGRHADAKLLGIPGGGTGAQHMAPSRQNGPVTAELAQFQAAGLATVKLGKATAHATWERGYRCGRTGPLTRSAVMLGGLSLLDGTGPVPALQADRRRTGLLRVGPSGSTQTATDLVPVGRGRIGVRSAAGAALSDLSLFAGTPQEISIKVINQPRLEVIAGGDRANSKVTYKPAMLSVTAAGESAHVLKDAGTAVSLDLLGGIEERSPAALQVRVSLGDLKQQINGRQVRAEAASVRVQVKLGQVHVLDVTLGHLSAAACAPAAVHDGKPYGAHPRGRTSPTPAAVQPAGRIPASPPSPVASPSPSAGTPDGQLALTGTDVTAYGFGGAALVLGGLLALLFGRRGRRN